MPLPGFCLSDASERAEAPPQQAPSDDQQQRSVTLRWLLFLCDCERVLVSAGGAPGTWDGDARFAGVVSTAGS
jgi:hypothetical protein